LFPDQKSTRTLDLLTKNYAADTRMKDVIGRFNPWDDSCDGLLRAVMEKHADKATCARACRLRLIVRQTDITNAEEYLAKPNLRRNLEQRTPNGVTYYRKVVANLEQNRKDAEDLQKLLEGKYAGVLPRPILQKPIPDVDLTDLEGKKHCFRDLKGKIVVIELMATDQPLHHLDEDLKVQAEFMRRYKDRPVAFVNIGLDERIETFQELLRKHPSPAWNCWAGAHSDFAYDWRQDVTHNPDCLWIDPEGCYQLNGSVNRETLDELLVLMNASGKLGKRTKATDAFAELSEKHRKACADPQELDHVSSRFPKLYSDLAERFADEPVSFYFAWHNVCQFYRCADSEQELARSVKFIAKHHVSHPDMKYLLEWISTKPYFAGWEEETRLASAVFDSSSDPETQGYACRILLRAREHDLIAARYYLDHPEEHEALESQRPDGRDYYKHITKAIDSNKKLIPAYEELLKTKFAVVLEKEQK
jgi:hypothetical protein